MRTAPINIFQKLMQKWEAVHPYNAAQVMDIRGECNAARLQSGWDAALVSTGLGRINRNGTRYGFEALNGQAAVYGISFPKTSLSQHLSDQLNQPFANSNEPPFRPFIIQEGDHFFAGVIYQHWIADSAAIRMLLHEWFVRVYDPGASRHRPLSLPVDGYWNTIGPHRGGWDVNENTLAMIRRHTRLRRAQKIDSTALSNHQTSFRLFPAPDGLIPKLREYAAVRQVKLNDIFLAALAETSARHVPLQRRPSRTDVAVGSITDLRPYCPTDLSNTFGLFLGFTNVVCRPSELENFDRLLHIVSNQTKLAKSTGVAPSSLIWMSAAIAIGKLSRPDELYHFYRKELPLAAGISNVDLTKTWAAQYPSLLLQYIRVSPTGPMTPVVVTTTTLGEKFHIGLTHRIGLISAERATLIGQTLLSRLTSLA
jgi:hypothetical protein